MRTFTKACLFTCFLLFVDNSTQAQSWKSLGALNEFREASTAAALYNSMVRDYSGNLYVAGSTGVSSRQSYNAQQNDSLMGYQDRFSKDTLNESSIYISVKNANQTFFNDTTTLPAIIKPINKKRLWLTIGGTVSTLGMSYMYANNAWWKGEKTAFHLDRDETSASVFNIFHGRDSKYAKNVDKLAHFYGGVIFSEFFASQLRAANIPDKKAGLYGALLSSTVQAFIEVKDGTAPRWGFSVLDVASGSLGSFYVYAKNYMPALAATDVKISYYRHDDFYFTVPQANEYPSWADDYMNMTFWFSYNPARLLQQGKQVHPKWPKWLCIATGFGVDNTLNSYCTGQNLESNKGKGNYEWYIAPDIDFTYILPKTKFFRYCAKLLNMVKFPLPTLRLTPNLEFYPLYF